MNKFIAAIVALVILLAAIVVLAPSLIPAKSYKGAIEKAASNALGRSVTMSDDVSFKIFPRTAFSVTDLKIANAEGFEGDHLASVAKADIGVGLLPLLSGGTVRIEKFILIEPNLNFQKAANGDANWTLTSESASNENDSDQRSDQGSAGPGDISLGDVRITNGRAVFADASADKTYTAEDINVSVKLRSLKEPLEVKGDLTFQGAPATIDLILTTLADISANEPANMKLEARLGSANVGADLTLTGGETLSYNGPISINAPDLPAFAAIFDVALEAAPGFDNLSANGDASGTATGISLKSATINFDKIDASGDLFLNWAGSKPKATGSLNVGSLDLRPYMPAPAETSGGFPAWSEAKIDFSSLKNLDADLNIRANEVFLNDIRAGESQMRVTIDRARLVAEIPRLSLYGGGGSGRLVVNARRATPSFAGNFNTTSVQAEPFAADVLKNDRLLGLGGLRFDFTASGSSQAAIMSSLGGKGGFDLSDGAIKGVNLANMARTVAGLQEGGGLTNPAAIAGAISQARQPGEQTDFSKFLSQFVITNGVATAPTISLEGPFLTMSGNGTVNLAAQTIDIRLAPKATTTADGQGGRTVAIPIKVGGTFAQPSISVDVESLIRGRAEDAVKGVLGNVLGGGENGDENEGGARSILKGILGGGEKDNSGAESSGAQTDDTASTEDAVESLASEALGSLFGSRKKKTDADDKNDDGE